MKIFNKAPREPRADLRYIKPSKVKLYGKKPSDGNDYKDIFKKYELTDKVFMVGAPFDYGIELIKGRVGAAEGPDAIRKAIKGYGKLTNPFAHKPLHFKVGDAGNLVIKKKNSLETHERLEDTLIRLLGNGSTGIVLGGGHDLSYANVKALWDVYGLISGINYDAHYDVREVVDGKITSGTPFRRVIEGISNFKSERFIEAGMHDPKNSPEHYEFLKKNNVCVIKLNDYMEDTIRVVKLALSEGVNAIFCSVDIDGFPEFNAPGCSAPGKEGFSPFMISRHLYELGTMPKVKLLDIMEVNPKYDTDGKTATLAASLIASFLMGVNERWAKT